MRQKGAALAYAMLVIAVGSGIVALITRTLTNQQVELKIYERQLGRDAIARRLGESIINPLYILSSIPAGVNFLPGNKGNDMLRTCLGTPNPNPTQTATLTGNTISGNACNMNGVNPNIGWEFLLFPQAGYVAGTPLGTSNCPAPGLSASWNTRSLSCFIAGSRNGLYVAYNEKGDTNATVNAQFPFTAKVFFKPVCRINNPAQTACQFAEAIDFRYELTETVSNPRVFKLGTYPVVPPGGSPQWNRVYSVAIVGMKCNSGAVAVASESAGVFECQCFRPYVPVLDPATNQPVINSRGPTCVNKGMCPPGTFIQGIDQDSNPICQPTVTATKVAPGDTFSTADTPSTHSCNPNNTTGGWVANIDRTCYSSWTPQYKECPAGCSIEWWPILVGAIAGIFATLAATMAAAILSRVPIIGAPFIPIAVALQASLIARLAAMAILVTVGGLLGYFLQDDWDWLYIDTLCGHTPYIYCTISMLCGYIQ